MAVKAKHCQSGGLEWSQFCYRLAVGLRAKHAALCLRLVEGVR